jgi:cobalt-zinc-cadmium resistance protein CzcA
MLPKLIEQALKARVVVLVLTLVMAGAGTWAFLTLPIDAYPDIAPTQVKLILKAPGMTPEEVESRVVAPVETEMLGIPGQVVLRSIAKYAIADITIDFRDDTDIYWARSQVAERLANVLGDLPGSVEGGLAPISTPLSEMFMFTIEGPGSLAEKRRLLDWTIRPALRTVPGVADVNALGGHVETFEIRPDPTALAAAGLSLHDVQAAVEANNRNDGAGRLGEGEEALIVRAVGAIRTPEDLAEIVVRSADGAVTRLGDVAQIGMGSLTRYGAVTAQGEGEAVQGLVISLRGSDASRVVDGVRARLDSLKDALPEGTSVHIFYDRSDLIARAVGTVEKALLEATVLVVVLLLLFLGNLRAALIVAVVLPLASLTTFLMMKGIGLTANLMSLGGLAIAIGLIIDGAVVVVENVVERLSDPKHSSSPRINLVLVAASEVAAPVSAGIVIIALVFLPLLSLQGLEGKMFGPVAITVIMALVASLVLALVLVPVLASYVLKPSTHHEPWLMRQIQPGYGRLLNAAFAYKPVVYGAAALSLVLAVAAYTMVGKTFMPTMDEGAIVMQTSKLPSIGLQRSLEVDVAIQKAILASVPEVTGIISRVGSDEIGLDPMSLNETDAFMTLKPRNEWRRQDREWLVEEVRQVMETIPSVEASFTQPIEMRVSEMLTGSRGDLAVKIFGPDLAVLGELAAKIEAALVAVPGATDVLTVANDKGDYLQLEVDRLAMGRAGLSVEEQQDALRMQIEGLRVGVAADGLRRIPVVIRGDAAIRDDVDAFSNLQMHTPDGGLARVSDLARIERVEGPVKIEHENGSRFALVQAFVSGRDLVGFVEDAQAAVAEAVPMPDGYRVVWGGQFENQQRAAARLAIVVPVAILLIYCMLIATLRSARASVLILLNIPFALVGGIIALFLTGEYLSVPASVGFIALLGIAVLNGLVLVSYFRHLRDGGMTMADAVRRGAERRLRPVLMTATITAFGLVPLLFATGPGSEIQRPLAIVVIGGLISSTLLTLVLLPLLYERFGESRTEAAA